MKKLFVHLAFIVLFVFATACSGGETKQDANTAHDPGATDTMPTLQPGNFDSSGTIETPSTGDENVIMPDSAIRN